VRAEVVAANQPLGFENLQCRASVVVNQRCVNVGDVCGELRRITCSEQVWVVIVSVESAGESQLQREAAEQGDALKITVPPISSS
jgi:hypothetical protein